MIKTLQIITLALCFMLNVNLIAQPTNDSCHDARAFTNLNNGCVSLSFQGATFDGRTGTCSPNDFANTWFEFIAQGNDINIEVMSTFGDAYVTLWDVNQAQPCNDSLFRQELCATNLIILGNRLTIGRIYKISVSFQSSAVQGYQICINNPIPTTIPNNDRPCGANFVDVDGTCSTGSTNNATSDWFNPDCRNGSESTVWYKLFLNPGHSQLRVILNPTFSGAYSMFLVRFNNNSCNSFPIIVGDTLYCDNLPNPDTVIFDNLSSNTLYYLQIASRDNGTGTFSFCPQELEDPGGCGINDNCLLATDISVMASNPDTTCFSGCNRSALQGPTDLPGTCYYMEHPTVWHVIEPDVASSALRIIVSSLELTNPQVALYVGDTCSDLSPVLCDYSTTGYVDVAIFDVMPGQKYFLAVSDLFGAEGDYDVCVDQFSYDTGCKLISSIRPVNTSFGSPIAGPYQSGESVTFCYRITAWQKGLCNWLQGIAPRFGRAWDPASFRVNGEPVIVNQPLEEHVPGTWRWHRDGSVQYNIDNPGKGYLTGSPCPAGWYFTNDGYDPIDPDFSRGDSDNCDFTPGETWEICFTLKIKDYEDCLDLGSDEASILMETFADGEIGIYPAVSCLNDQPNSWIGPISCCQGQSIPDANINKCNGSNFVYNLNPTNDPNLNFSWDPIIPNGVFGATAGTGSFIDDHLFNFTSTPQTVRYIVSISDSTGCFGEPATISVNIQSRIIANAGIDRLVCEGRTVFLGGNPTAQGGAGNYSYNWSSGSDDRANPLYQVDENELVVLRVTDSRGCRATDSVQLSTIPSPRTSFTAAICFGDTFYFNEQKITESGTFIDIISNGAANGCDSIITADVLVYDAISISDQTITPSNGSDNGSISIELQGGTPPYNVSWSNGASGTILTDLKNGLYQATVLDANNCMMTFSLIVPLMSSARDLTLEASINIQPNPIEHGKSWFINNSSIENIKSISVHSIDGKTVNQINLENGIGLLEMPLVHQANGLLILKIETEKNIIYKKLLIH